MTMIRLFRPRTSHNGYNELSNWNDVLDRFFENDNRLDYNYAGGPKTNIIENEDHYRIDMYVPGVSKSDLKVEVDGDLLVISKPVKQDEEEGFEFLLREFRPQNFERRYSLPDDANVEKINADYSNGILSVTVWKKEEARQVKKTISIG